MQYTEAMREVEERFGQPIRNLILDLYGEHRSLEKVASIIGVERVTVFNWRLRLNITEADLQESLSKADVKRQHGMPTAAANHSNEAGE